MLIQQYYYNLPVQLVHCLIHTSEGFEMAYAGSVRKDFEMVCAGFEQKGFEMAHAGFEQMQLLVGCQKMFHKTALLECTHFHNS